MSKKLILILALVLFFTFNNFALADLIINEIMYDPPGADANAEWIKVQNTGPTSIDLSTWYVADYDTSWHFHKIKGENETILSAGAEALVVNTSQVNFADFKIKMPNYNGLLFRSSFTLGNDKGRLGMSSDKKNILSDTTYSAPEPVIPVSVAPVKVVKENSPTATKKISAETATPPNPPLVKERAQDGVYSDVILASTMGNNKVVEQNPESSYPSPIIFVVSFLFIGAGAGGVYFIRRKKITPQIGSDFEILDE